MSPAPRQRRQGLNRRHSSEEDEEEDVSEGEDSQVDSYEENDDDTEEDDDEEEEDDDVDSAVGLLDSDEDSFDEKKSMLSQSIGYLLLSLGFFYVNLFNLLLFFAGRKASGNTSTKRFNAKKSAKNVQGRQSGPGKKQPRSSQERQQSAQHQKKKPKTGRKAG